MHCFNLKVKHCFNLTADLTRQLLENGKIAGVSTRSRGDTHQPESVCAFLYEPDVLIFGKFIVKRFFYLFAEEKWKFMQYWPVRAVVVVNTVVKVGKLVDAEPLVDRVVLVLQARLEKKRISRRNLEAFIKTDKLPFPRRSPNDRSRHEWSCLLRLVQRWCSKQGRGIWSTWCNHHIVAVMMIVIIVTACPF